MPKAGLGILIDENLSPALASVLQPVVARVVHVRQVGLASASDTVIWSYAIAEELAILSKDSDFHQRSFVFGHPPKVIWLRVGNSSVARQMALLESKSEQLASFLSLDMAPFMAIGW